MNSSQGFPETQEKRAQWFKSHGGVNAVVEAGLLSNTVSLGLTEVLVLGLIITIPGSIQNLHLLFLP